MSFRIFLNSIHSKYASRLFAINCLMFANFLLLSHQCRVYYDKLPSLTVSPSWLHCRAQALADKADSNWNLTRSLLERIELPQTLEQTFREIFFFGVGFDLIALAGDEDRWHLLSGVGRQVGTKHDTLTTQHYTCHEINSQPHTILTQNLQHFHLKLFLQNYHLWIYFFFFMFS